MKKLMAMLVSLACASGAWAAKDQADVYPSGVDFDSVEIEEGKTEADYTISGDAKWSGATGSEDALKVMAWKDGDYLGTYPERLVTSSGSEKNYLSLETTFATPLYRAIKDDMAADDSYGEQVYLDSLVNLTAGEASSLDGADLSNDARIALWLQEGDADAENSTPVLCIKAATYNSVAGSYKAAVFTNTWEVTAGWHRLTVRCFKDVTRTGAKIPAYAVYVDGVAVTAGVKAFPDTTGFVPKCAALAEAGSLFGSLQGASGAAESNIKAVGFAGNGKVDDIIFTTTKPNLENIDDTNYFHLTWDEGVKSIAYVIGEGQSVAVDCTEGEAGATDIALTGEAMSIAVTVTYSEGCGKGAWTAENGAGIDDGATTFTIGADAVTPGGAIVSASTKTVGSAVVTIGGTALETITATTLSDLIEAIGTAIADQTLADTDTIYIKLMDNVEFDNSDAEGYISLGKTAGVWTLDLNGKTVTCNASSADYQAIVNMGALVVTDSSSDKLGKIEFASTNNIGYAVYNYASGQNAVLTIEAGTFDGSVSGAVDEEASGVTSTITITGGKFLASANQTEGDSPTFSLASCVDTEKYTITLTDGYYVVASKDTPVVTTYTVTFVNEKAEQTTDTKTVNKDATVAAPDPAPEADGFKFLGWFLTTDGVLADTAFDFTTTITGDITLTAKWAEFVTLTVADYDTAQITSVTITDANKNEYQSGAQFVKDDATVLTITPVFAEGYELDTEKSSALEITMNQNQTVTLVAKASAPTVAKIGDVEYKTLEGDNGAIAAAIAKATADGTSVTINICHDIDLTDPNTELVIAGSGIDVTKIVLNVSEGVTVTLAHGSSTGIYIDNATVTFTGKGTWAKVGNSTVIRIGEKTAAANVTIDGGVFTAGRSSFEGDVADVPSNIINVKQGELTINDGTFTTEGTRCVRANNAAGKLTVNGGAFETKNASTDASAVVLYAAGGTIEIPSTSTATFKGCAANILAYMVDEITKGEADEAIYTLAKNADGAYAVTTLAAADVVATIGTTSYATLEDALQAAVGKGEATITILADCSFDSTITLVGKGADTTKITIENDKVVSFPTGSGVYGIFLDGLSLTLKGTGTWQKTAESASMFLAGEKSAAANITVEGGNFYAKAASCIMNVQQGVITVNGGTFTTENAGGYCVRAEKSDVTKTTGGEVLVTAGTFNGPTTDGAKPLVGIKNAESVAAGAEVMILVSDNVKAVGSAKAADLMGEYLVTKTGTDEYTYTDDYKFKLTDVANTYAITAIEWAKLTVTWDAGVKSFTVAESASGDSTNVVISADLDSFVEQYDKDDGESVTITVTLNDDYTLNNEASTLTGIEMTGDQTIALATTKTAVEPTTYDPGEVEATTYETESAATDGAKKINDAIEAGTASINAPTGLSDDATKAYKALFAAKVVTVTDGGSTSYQVKIDFTDQATSDLQAQVDADVKIVELTKIAAAEDDASVETEVTTTPGLWYTVYAGNDLTAELTATSCKQATDAKTKLEFPKKGTRGFYKIGVSIKPIE